TTMKMMSSTSTTSTSGVTFMSGWTGCSATRLRHATLRSLPLLLRRRGVLLRLLLPALDRIEQLAGRRVQRAFVARDLRVQIVVGEHRGDGDGEAERRLDQRFRDAGRHRR